MAAAPALLRGRKKKQPRSRGAVLRVRVLWHGKKNSLPNKEGRRSAGRRTSRTGLPPRRCRPNGSPARSRLRGRSPFGAPPRFSPEAFRPKAQSGPALHGRGQPIRSPGSQLLADRRRGRPGEFPNRPHTVCETARGHRAHSTFRIASGTCPSMSEPGACIQRDNVVKRCRNARDYPLISRRFLLRPLFPARRQGERLRANQRIIMQPLASCPGPHRRAVYAVHL
jgi:hypothetical protein